MKLTLIGTGAGEGYPGLWCDCPNCRAARARGGKNLRGHCSALLDGELLLDLNLHFFEMAPRLGIHPAAVRYLLVTHPHPDHFTPWLLRERAANPAFAAMGEEELRRQVSPCFTDLPLLAVFGGAYVRRALAGEPGLLEQADQCRFSFREIEAGVPFEAGPYRVTPVRSNHTPVPGYTHNFIIRRDGRTLLYATDTGGYDPDMRALVLRGRYDAVVVEGTFGLGADVPGHMNLERDKAFRAELLGAGCIAEDTPVCLTHLCPHWAPPHDEYERIVRDSGMLLGWDGMDIAL